MTAPPIPLPSGSFDVFRASVQNGQQRKPPVLLEREKRECICNIFVTVVVGGRRRGPRCSVVHVHDLLITLNTRTKKNKHTKKEQNGTNETVLSGTETETENNYSQIIVEKQAT